MMIALLSPSPVMMIALLSPCFPMMIALYRPYLAMMTAHSSPSLAMMTAHSSPSLAMMIQLQLPCRYADHKPYPTQGLDDPLPQSLLLDVLHAAVGALLLGHPAAVTCLMVLLAMLACIGVSGPAQTDMTCKLDTPLATLASIGDPRQCSRPDGKSCLLCGLRCALLALGVGDTGPMTSELLMLWLCLVTSPTLPLSWLLEAAVATAQMLPWLCCTRKMSPCSEGTAKGRGQEDPLDGGQGGPGHVDLLDRGDAQDELHAGGGQGQAEGGPGGEGEGDIEDMTSIIAMPLLPFYQTD